MATSLVPTGEQAVNRKPAGPIDTLRALLDRSKTQLALALPKHLTVDRLIRVAITAVQKTPALMECEPLSILGSIMTAAQLGLEPDGILGLAYLVPFYNGKTKRKEAQLQIGYKGFIALARRSGVVSTVYSEIVHEKDPFKVTLGTKHELFHEPLLDLDDRGPVRGAYAVVFFKDGTHDFEYMSRAQIEKIRNGSPAVKAAKKLGFETPWDTNTEEMFKKTPIRRLAKRMPLSVEDNNLVKAAMLDEFAENGISQQAAAEVTDSGIVAQATNDRMKQLQEKYAAPEPAEAAHVPEAPFPASGVPLDFDADKEAF